MTVAVPDLNQLKLSSCLRIHACRTQRDRLAANVGNIDVEDMFTGVSDTWLWVAAASTLRDMAIWLAKVEGFAAVQSPLDSLNQRVPELGLWRDRFVHPAKVFTRNGPPKGTGVHFTGIVGVDAPEHPEWRDDRPISRVEINVQTDQKHVEAIFEAIQECIEQLGGPSANTFQYSSSWY